jgi:hypothetical protein
LGWEKRPLTQATPPPTTTAVRGLVGGGGQGKGARSNVPAFAGFGAREPAGGFGGGGGSGFFDPSTSSLASGTGFASGAGVSGAGFDSAGSNQPGDEFDGEVGSWAEASPLMSTSDDVKAQTEMGA